MAYRLTVLMFLLFVADPAAADDRHEWLDPAWWSEGQLPVPPNHKVTSTTETLITDEADIPIFIARPETEGEFPGVLFVHGRRGVDPLIEGHVQRLAARGFVVYAPDLYVGRFVEAMPIEHDYALEADLNDVLDHVLATGTHSGDRVCVYSHTRGGYKSLKLAVTLDRQSDALACYVSYYPHMQDPNAPEPMQVYRYAGEADRLTLPALIFVGEHEQYQRKRGIDMAVGSMQGRGLPVQLVTYPGVGRGFDFREPPVRTFADDLATRDALMRATAFMNRQLRAGH
ncbi:putative dienelactone hydrolase [Thioalkalivibrio nitratireducens DSM 14787]|uniref:Dienelactone hydrolase n=1 Tax=Thioalkalivibrio nitratireducens (strain DSM 14787 / UNIQEM 213 / ALEN2) TaxID=1255043 RepID=L0DUE1_THIND|nr:dienelactone hydrolase family protein [Thioalkalivibrio nitratireducens]AGA31956.1 putative dienelactone hydrolase [Thioalkalivibrio nitratireducens DSM 14787]